MSPYWLARLLVTLGVVTLCWAVVAAWLTVFDSHHREFYAGPGAVIEVQQHGRTAVSLQPGTYFGVPVPGLHEVTVLVLVASGALLITAGVRIRSMPARPSTHP